VGEEIQNQQVIGYACGWLAWTCILTGPIKEAIMYGERALKIAESFPSDQYLFFKTLGGIGYAYIHKGDKKKALQTGRTLLEYGKKNSNARSIVLGHFMIGFAHFVDEAFPKALEASGKAVQLAADPYYEQFSKILLAASYGRVGRYQEAEPILKEVLIFSEAYGCENAGVTASANLGLLQIAMGQMGQGLKRLEDAVGIMIEKENRAFHMLYELNLGQVYLGILNKTGSVSLSAMVKNIGFIIKNVPSAAKKARNHFDKAIEIAEEIGANGGRARAYLYLGLLHHARDRADEAKECISQALPDLEQCGLEESLKKANDVLASLYDTGDIG
jgi:tetratricopeptide (TPR) repeat protein